MITIRGTALLHECPLCERVQRFTAWLDGTAQCDSCETEVRWTRLIPLELDIDSWFEVRYQAAQERLSS